MSPPDTRFDRWPLLAASIAFITIALGLEATETAERFGTALLLLGACFSGAFLYAEGARHREWWAGPDDDDGNR